MVTADLKALAGAGFILARLWASEIDETFIEQIESMDSSGPFSFLSDVQELLNSKTRDEHERNEMFDELAADFCRIMIGPGDHAAPVQSVWKSGSLSGETADQVNEIVSCIANVQLPVTEIVDHFANEIWIASVLLLQAHEVQDSNDDLLDALNDFYRSHVAWGTKMTVRAQQFAQTEFYKNMLNTTRQWLDELDSVLSMTDKPSTRSSS
ncbi:MAG: molecular chaperone TorD family protein [Pirellulaceae bacterium]